jgi:hypothetical protein
MFLRPQCPISTTPSLFVLDMRVVDALLLTRAGFCSPLRPFHRMLNQTLNYLDHFARFTQKENVEAVERLLSAHKDLAKFERAQLGMDKSSTAT